MFPRMADLDIALFPEYRQIPLTYGYVAIVDAANYEWLMQWKWYAQVRAHTVYAVRSSRRGPIRLFSMHRFILSTPMGLLTDHRDGNGLMNTYDNLRVCTH